MYDTATKAQFIDLRARGWSYDKIARHTGISKPTLLNWGREYAADIETLKADYISPRTAFPDGTAQESYFHNLPGESTPISTTQKRGLDHNPNLNRRNAAKPDKSKLQNRKSKIGSLRRGFRKFMRSPIVRAAIRYAVLKH